MFQRAFAYGEPTKATDVVYIDYSCGVGGQRKKPRGCALGHRWTPVHTSGERIHASCLTSYIDRL